VAQDDKMTSKLDDDEVQNLQIGGFGNRGVNVINESGLYSCTLTSKKPEAKAFKKWVTSEVLPSIRKTGSYTAPAKQDVKLSVAASEFKALLSISKSFGLKGNQALLSANAATRKNTGIDFQKMLDIELEAPVQTRLVTVSDVGLMVNLSGNKVNQLLKAKGFQTDSRDSKNRIVWTPTALGLKHSTLIDTGKKHGDGAPVQQVKWLESIVSELGL
jgi:prophage antirepressor-like protein